MTSARDSRMDCTAFGAQLGEYLEGALGDGQRAAMDAHRSGCSACAQLVADLDVIVAGAGALPPLSPSRDLWPGIEARINTPVVALGQRSTRLAVRMVSVRALAAAAAMLVTVSSGVTWLLLRAPATSSPTSAPSTSPAAALPTVGNSTPSGARPAPNGVAPAVTPASSPTPVVAGAATTARTATPNAVPSQREPATFSAATRARVASRGSDDVGLIYEREIRSMRRIVDERLGDLDSATVAEVERNLTIIDRAIEDSRRALERDPRSRFLSTQLDRALENKLAIMRRVALL